MLKCAVVGGTRIVFTRYNGVGVTKIRGHRIENLKFELELSDHLPKPSKTRCRVKEKLDECPENPRGKRGLMSDRGKNSLCGKTPGISNPWSLMKSSTIFSPPRKYSSLKGSPLSRYTLNLIFQET